MSARQATFAFDVAELSLDGGAGELTVVATVTETATGEVQNATAAAVTVQDASLHVQLDGPSYMQPGLSYRATLQVQSSDGTLPATVGVAYETSTVSGPSTRRTLSASVDPTTGAAEITLALPAEQASCCSPADGISYWGDALAADSCCLTSLSVSVQSVDGSSNLAQVATTTLYASRASSPSGAYLAVRDATPAGALPGVLTVNYEMTAPSATVHWAAMGRLGVLAAGQTAASGTGSIQVRPRFPLVSSLDIDPNPPTSNQRHAGETLGGEHTQHSTASPSQQ